MQLNLTFVLGVASVATAVTLTPTTVKGGACPTRTIFVPTVSTKTDIVTKTDTVVKTQTQTVTTTTTTTTTCRPVPKDCPTLTTTATACRTCFLPGCTEVVTTTQSCGCPAAAPTATLSFPCGEPDVCNKIGCTTRYVVATEAC